MDCPPVLSQIFLMTPSSSLFTSIYSTRSSFSRDQYLSWDQAAKIWWKYWAVEPIRLDFHNSSKTPKLCLCNKYSQICLWAQILGALRTKEDWSICPSWARSQILTKSRYCRNQKRWWEETRTAMKSQTGLRMNNLLASKRKDMASMKDAQRKLHRKTKSVMVKTSWKTFWPTLRDLSKQINHRHLKNQREANSRSIIKNI